MNHSENTIPVESGYDRWSGFYDSYSNSTVAVDDRHFPLFYQGLRGADVLEVGCGTGRHTRRLLEQGNRVTGIDISSGMLEIARGKLGFFGQLQLIHADFLKTDASSLERFDAIVTALVIEHIPDLDAFFCRTNEALGPHGEVYISEIHPLRAAEGTLANFVTADEGIQRLASVAHTANAIEKAATVAGFVLIATQDIVGDQDLVRTNSAWQKHLGKPLVKFWHWRKG